MSTALLSDSTWLLDELTGQTPGAEHAIVASADGLVLAASTRLPSDRADQLAAVASGLIILNRGAARCFDAGAVAQTIIEMDRAYLLVMPIGDGSALALLASPDADLGLVGFEMARQVARFGRQLDPVVRQPEFHGAAG